MNLIYKNLRPKKLCSHKYVNVYVSLYFEHIHTGLGSSATVADVILVSFFYAGDGELLRHKRSECAQMGSRGLAFEKI